MLIYILVSLLLGQLQCLNSDSSAVTPSSSIAPGPYQFPDVCDIMASVSQTESENPLKRIIDFMPTVDDSYYDFHSKKALSAFVPGTRLVFRKQACTETGHKPACMTYTATIYDSTCTFVVWVYNPQDDIAANRAAAIAGFRSLLNSGQMSTDVYANEYM
ncbi:hypothetical protein C8Q76DRAFT_790205 [Earliella scabrosa]|nr:hypothetical protein C8Q76DRAFT_790205 [Earliella scabrosa]